MDRPILVIVALCVVIPATGLVQGTGLPAEDVSTIGRELALHLDGTVKPTDRTRRLEPVEGIGPGSRLRIERPDGSYGCTANFIFEDPDGNRYLGTAGHCLMPSDRWGTHGPFADLDPDGIEVAATGACPVQVYATSCLTSGDPVLHELGDVVYARDGYGSDFAVIEIPDRHDNLVRPTMPEWGGPDGAAVAGDGDDGDTVLYYGHGEGPGRAVPTRARSGVLLETAPNSTWWHAGGESAWGDSGSPVVLAAEADSPMTGGPALGIVTHLAIQGVKGPRIHHALGNVRCWAGLDLRVVPNGTFLGECPRPEIGSVGEHGTAMAADRGGDADLGTAFADIERVWLDSDGSHARITFRVSDLRPNQPRTRYKSHWGSPNENGAFSSVYCYTAGHGGVLSSPLECNGYPAEWDVERDLFWAEIPYAEFGWESGDTVAGVFGGAQTGDPIWYRVDLFEGNGTHTLS